MVARYYESTDDVYVASDIVQITSEVSGAVLGLVWLAKRPKSAAAHVAAD